MLQSNFNRYLGSCHKETKFFQKEHFIAPLIFTNSRFHEISICMCSDGNVLQKLLRLEMPMNAPLERVSIHCAGVKLHWTYESNLLRRM